MVTEELDAGFISGKFFSILGRKWHRGAGGLSTFNKLE